MDEVELHHYVELKDMLEKALKIERRLKRRGQLRTSSTPSVRTRKIYLFNFLFLVYLIIYLAIYSEYYFLNSLDLITRVYNSIIFLK